MDPGSAPSAALVGVIADDLTSAADGAAPFVARGLDARVGLGGAVPAIGAVRSVDTGSRVLAPAAAADRAGAAAAALAGSRILYKTVDSTLRGHVAAEVAAALERGARSRVVFAPAFPAAGRITRAGRQRVDGRPLMDTPYARDPLHPARTDDLAEALGGLGSRAVRVAAGGAAVGEHAEVVILDAETQSDLDRFVASVARPERCLWVGSPGLALALAARFGDEGEGDPRASATPRAARVLVAIGSANPASRAQLGVLAGGGVPVVDIGEDAPGGARVVATATPAERAADPVALCAAFSGHAARLLRDGGFDGLVVTGGETADRTLRGAGVAGFKLRGELEPGFPVGLAGEPEPLVIAMKAGGFGGPGTLRAAARKLIAGIREVD